MTDSAYNLVFAPPVDLGAYAPRQAPVFGGQVRIDGSLALAAGTAAQPVLGFAADDDTGLYLVAPNILGLATAGVQRAQLATNLSVGYGLTGIYDSALIVRPTGHATSRRAAIQFGSGWILGQDSNGNGVSDFFLFNPNTARAVLQIAADDVMTLGGAGGAGVVVLRRVASQVNNLALSGAATGAPPILAAEGVDANIDLALVPKGTTGRVRFGAWQSLADTAVSGFIEIRDATGVLRKLATIA